MRVKHQPYINPILASWFVPFGTYHRILISYMPHTAAWKTQLASTFWVWNTLQARAVGYVWIILLDLLPFLALMNAVTILNYPLPTPEMTRQPMWKYVQLTWANLPRAAKDWAHTKPLRQLQQYPKTKAHHGFVPFKPALPKTSQKTTAKFLMRLVLTGNREVGVPSPGANLVQLARGGFAIRLSGGPGSHWCWITPNKAYWCEVETCCFRMNRRKTRKCLLFSNGILLLHDYNIMESFNNLACGWFHL